MSGAAGRYLAATLGSVMVLLGGTAWVVHEHDASMPTVATTRVAFDTFAIELAETYDDKPLPAATSQMVPAPVVTPQPQTTLPVLADTMGEFDLFQPPAIEQTALPALTIEQPTLNLPSMQPSMHRLPEITLPPMQPIEVPTEHIAEATSASQGATARVEQKARLTTDLSKLLKRYPPEALKHRWEGTVVLRLKIGAGGILESADVEVSSGYRVLDKEALRMIKSAQFEGGPGELLQTIEFKLKATRHAHD